MTPSAREAPPALPLHTRVRRVLGHVRRRFVFDTFDVFGRPTADAPPPLAPPDGYRVRFGDAADLARCTEHHTELSERDRALGIRRLEELGHRLVVIEAPDGELVFTMWVNPRNINVPGGIKRCLGAGRVFIYKAYTSPDHRGRRLYRCGMEFVVDDLARGGGAELIGYAHTSKDVSRRGLASSGFHTRGRFRVVGLSGRTGTLIDSDLRRHFPDAVPRTGLGLDR